MACKKQVFQVFKVSKVDGTATVIGEPFDTSGEVVDPTTLTDCPERQYITGSVCVTTDGTDCLEGAKCITEITYDCATDLSTAEVVSYVLPDGTTVPAAEFVAPYAVIPCPIYDIVSTEKCDVVKG